MRCANCGAENAPAARFCSECGAGLEHACPTCAAPYAPGAKFCSSCGTALAGPSPVAPPGTAPVAERRLVSVLFADLVGFTTASEGRDAEDTRDLLTRYFDTCRTIIERYGGTVEKFIGDAVMAVWGAPTANEDDAERAVRAALELVDAIPGLDDALRARAGVLTGEAAVTLGATDQGMVAGDLVNTAARIQSAAEPGSVLVGQTTRHATESSIVFADAGEHEMKGKTEPVALSRAMRVAAQRRGGGRAAGLEAPFVGRDAELRLVKAMFHASADESRSRLVSVVGVAGIGKSRLSWEFEKYIDGLAADVWWHRGRCLSYGDGVAYWALAEMVRGRAQIVEDEAPEAAAAKLRAMIETSIADIAEREWVEPRLLQLLGLSDRSAPDREDLFSAWRRFFERLAEQGPLVMVFEDLHWADEGLVAFVEYLLDWGRHHPIFVVTLSRPDVADRHPGFPGSTRSSTTLPLEPLDDASMDELLRGLLPGLPDDVRHRLSEAADGIPLFAVEIVRMLRDRGVLEQHGDRIVVTGDLGSLEVPQTLQALITSRLDGIPEGERRLLQDASVLGKTFTARGLAALSGLTEGEVDEHVRSLLRKELLAIETDPFSPERGQLTFLQALVQRVTYETIARRDRRSRHLAAARFLAEAAGIDPDEIAEVIASHYLDAHEADPDATDHDDVRAQARAWFTRAAERAASLAASFEAQRAFERAAGLASEDVERATSLARAGDHAMMGRRFSDAETLLREAIAIFGKVGARSGAAEAQSRLGEVLFATNRIEEAVALLQPALAAHEATGDEAASATVSTQLGRMLYFEGKAAEALPYVDRALELGEQLGLAEVIVESLINKALIMMRRPNESLGLMRQALLLGEESGFTRGVLRASMNLSYLLAVNGRDAEADAVIERGITIARQRGDRIWEGSLTSNLVASRVLEGRWDEAEELWAAIPADEAAVRNAVHAIGTIEIATIAYRRGDTARALTSALPIAAWGENASFQTQDAVSMARALAALAQGNRAEATAVITAALRQLPEALDPESVTWFAALGIESSEASLESQYEINGLLDELVASGFRSPARLDAHLALLRARMRAGDGSDEPDFEAAITALGEIGDVFWKATAQLDHGEWLISRGRPEEAAAVLAEARRVLGDLRATPRLERLAKLEAGLGATTTP